MSGWKDVVGAVAPGLAALLGGPLAGGAVKLLADQLLGGSSGDPVQDEAQIAGLLANGATPELRAKIIDAESVFKLEALKAGLEEKRIDADLAKAEMVDVQHARSVHGTGRDVLALGCIILVAWAGITGATLFGLYQMLIGGIRVQDVGVVATVFTVLGTTVGYVSNVAQQVVGFYFGSSRGSVQKTGVMAAAIADAGRTPTR